ncbi:N-acetyltransferase [Thalassotalea insulae]|uniref:N-acetyltransferase n=1 Tax=Thalassotalea insulae TaxID=2056778 RepID=A0ABQ6GV46_9GAMM|nr:GNAT family N-acetyltransferase [Thalassotalea insulae]GLX78370.1 N-acetyltransferase [Thalassotalea insulae]
MLESKRLILKPPSLALQPAVLAAIRESKAELEQFLLWVPYALTEKQSIDDIKKAIENFNRFEHELRYFIVEKDTCELIGAIGLLIKDENQGYFELGYWLKTSATGQGFITEAVYRLEKHAFEQLNAKCIEIKAAETNVKSQAVALRCGYQYRATLPSDSQLPSGELNNTIVYTKTCL